MPTSFPSNNPLTLTVTENTKIRAVFKQVTINEITTEQTTTDTRWRDCVSGELKTGTPPSDYVQVAYNGAGGGSCWEPKAVIGFEPNLEEALKFNWRRGSNAYPEAKTINVTNPSNTAFTALVTSSVDIVVTPSTFTIPPRSSQTFSVRPTTSLLDRLADGISTIDFKIKLTEVI